jgi:hypothetical protein
VPVPPIAVGSAVRVRKPAGPQFQHRPGHVL